MSSQTDNPNVSTDGSKDVFQYAGLDPAEFHAKVFSLGDINIQQAEILGIASNDEPSQLRPMSIKEIIESPHDNDHNEAAESLGKNLLDSFALIFSRPGPGGVSATILERIAEEPNTHVLYVANNCGESVSSSVLAKDIQEWFGITDPYPETNGTLKKNHVDNPNLGNRYWENILWNCYPNIRKSIYETCYAKLRGVESKDDYHFLPVRELIYRVACPKSSDKLPPEAKGLVSVLDVMYQLGDYETSKTADGTVLRLGPLGDITPKMIRLIHKLTSQCYELLESYRFSMNTLIHRCYERLKYGDENKEIKRRNASLGRVRRLIYIAGEYCRAWYDIVRFKICHGPATMRIEFISGNWPSPRSMNILPIASAGLRIGVLEKEQMKKFAEKHRSSLNDQAYPYSLRTEPKDGLKIRGCASFFVHCEMQILEFLLTRDSSNFYNYIGCSKCPCWLCYHALVKMTPEFNSRKSHFKLYQSWLPPKFERNVEDREKFATRVLRFLDDEVWKLTKPGYIERAPLCLKLDCHDVEKRLLSPKTKQMRMLIGDQKIEDISVSREVPLR